MKTLATVIFAGSLCLAAVLPASSPVIDSATDTLIAGRSGIGSIPRPRADEQPVFEIDLDTLIAGRVGIGNGPRG